MSKPEQNKTFNPWNSKNREITPTDAIRILKKYGWKVISYSGVLNGSYFILITVLLIIALKIGVMSLYPV